MSGAHEPGSPSGDDLFDLPSDAPSAKDVRPTPSSAAGADLDLPASALPKRPMPMGPPLSNVDSTPAAIAEQVKKRPVETKPAEPAPVAAVRKPRFPRPDARWIAVGAFGIVNGLVLGFVVLRDHGATKTDHADGARTASAASALPPAEPEHAADGAQTPAHEPAPEIAHDPIPAAGHGTAPATEARPQPESEHEKPAREIPPLYDANALDLARKSLEEAREDVAAGRRGAARARLGRIGLSIDAVPPRQRDDLRAEIALLLAQTLQSDADEAARAKR